MLEKKRVFTRKRALLLLFICAAVLLALILLRWRANAQYTVSTLEGRQKFLTELGWETDAASEEYKSVVIPDSLEGIMKEYNEMQLKQGYDLGAHLGEKCEQYSYRLTNYPGEGTVLVTLYIQGRTVIAGDIHTSSINGFMHGIKRGGG